MITEHIEDEIERTRDEMASTLNAIERKLSPKQIMDQAVDTMRELASDPSRVAQVVRDNPVPLALIGLGIGWLAVSGSMGRKSAVAGGSYESMEGLAPSWNSAGGAPGVEDSAYGAAEYVGEGKDMRERASQFAGAARETVSRAADRTRGRVSRWSNQARSTANQAADRTRDAYQEHPLTMGLVAVLVGAAVGALLPRSRM
ncbi:MAG: DUF3618 domain-containing protein, partial [Magnetospirillum sp.]|nr:DUF3618 domain-containing protein [Magnetospirillum sp.]